jgi:hypothetical protein
LLDERQAVLDPISQCRARRGEKRARPQNRVVAGGEREQRPRLAHRVAQSGEQLSPRQPPLWIDCGSNEHESSHTFRPANSEGGDDLAAERVRNQRGTLEPERIQPISERVCQTADLERRARLLAPPVPGQVGHEDGETPGERPCQREHVAAGDTEPVHEHHRLSFAGSPRVEPEAADDDVPCHSCLAHRTQFTGHTRKLRRLRLPGWNDCPDQPQDGRGT